LLLSVVGALFCLSESWADDLQILSRIYLWVHIGFGISFVTMARVVEDSGINATSPDHE
jgi:hypothetical protein